MTQNRQRTRRQIIDTLKTDGPEAATALAKKFKLTGMAIRQHLYALQEEGFVDYTESPSPIGRPVKLWRLTKAADEYFPDRHADLTVGLISTMKEALGKKAFDAVLKARSLEQIESYKNELATTKTVTGKAKGLAKIRTREGYMAQVDKDTDGTLLLVENHCPICVAAQACTGLCQMELEVFQSTMGPDTKVERVDHILAGARRCAYRITQR